MPEVSIIIPLYNQAPYIKEAIESLNNQTYKDFETIVVNDGSSDDSLEIVKKLKEKYKNLQIKIIDQKNCGLSCARNRGIKESKSKYIIPLDADDKLSPDAVEKYLKAIKENDVDIVIANAKSFGEEDWISEKWRSNFKLLPYENQFTYCGLFKKSLWEETGGYKLNMDGGYEDWEFWINCYERGYRFYFIKEPLFLYRVKKESMLTDALKKDRHLKHKIILNHTALYPMELVGRAIEDIYKKRGHNQYFFYCDKDLNPDKKYALLEGSFSGYQNFGDILQLKEAIEFHKKNKITPIVLCNIESIENKEHIKRLYEYLNVEYIFFYSVISYDMKKYDLNFVKETKIDIFHLYGGGFLNRYWCSGYLNPAESAINYFDIKTLIVTAQQIDKESISKIEDFFKKYPPRIFGCRDKISYELLKGRLESVKYSFDDAYNQLKEIKRDQTEFYENKKDNILLHLNLTPYVTEDLKKALDEYKDVLKKIKQKYKNPKIHLLVAYNDIKVKDVRDTLNSIQSLEDFFDFKDVKIINLANLAMNKNSKKEPLKIKIPKNSIMITSSYHLAMFAKIADIPVYLFANNDYYRQKQKALNLEEDFEKFLKELPTGKEDLKEYDKQRRVWEEELKKVLETKGQKSLRRYSYQNSFYYLFPFYDKVAKYDIGTVFNQLSYIFEAWQKQENFIKEQKEYIEETVGTNKNIWLENRRLSRSWKEQKEYIKNQEEYIKKLEKSSKEGWEKTEELSKAWKEQKEYIQTQKDYIKELENKNKEGWNKAEELSKAWKKQDDFIKEQQKIIKNQEEYIKNLKEQKDTIWQESQKLSHAWEEHTNYIKSLEEKIKITESEKLHLEQKIESLENSNLVKIGKKLNLIGEDK